MEMADDLLPSRAVDVRFQDVNGQPMLVKGLNAFELNEIGTKIWRLCDGMTPVAAMVSELSASYDVDPGVLDADIKEYLAELNDNGLLE
jgi:pyrroloquinoline quinone biosynthesis protein D